jgi:transposase InsO family protein
MSQANTFGDFEPQPQRCRRARPGAFQALFGTVCSALGLACRGIPVGKQRVQKLKQWHGIRAKEKRRFKDTTDSNHDLPISPNLRNREYVAEEPDKVWVGDITPLAKEDGWLTNQAKQANSWSRLWDTDTGQVRTPIQWGGSIVLWSMAHRRFPYFSHGQIVNAIDSHLE